MTRTTLIVLALAAAVPSPAGAQSFQACQSEQSMRQVVESAGALKPDDCRTLTVTPVGSGERRLCALSFSDAGDDILQKLRDAALPDRWWVRCESLTGAVR